MGKPHPSQDDKYSVQKVRGVAAEKKAVELRIAGMSYREMAREMGYTVGGAYRAFERGLKKMEKHSLSKANLLRRLELERLDAALKAIWSRVEQGDLAAIDRLLKIMQQREHYVPSLSEPLRVVMETNGEIKNIEEMTDEELKRQALQVIGDAEKILQEASTNGDNGNK